MVGHCGHITTSPYFELCDDIKFEVHVRVVTCACQMVPLKCTVAFQNSAA